MKKYQTGLVIGRFQPFHLGHKFLIEKALHLCEKIIIGIGSSNITDSKNPYGIGTRIKFIEQFIEAEKLGSRVLKIISIEDVPDDDAWFEIVSKKTGNVDVVIGDNDWVNGIYTQHGVPVVEVGFYKRHLLEGVKIRRSMKLNKPWKNRVPDYLIPEIEKKK